MFDVHSHLPERIRTRPSKRSGARFRAPGSARLVLKSVNADADPDGYAELRALAGDAAIDFHDGYWPAVEIRDFLAACDAYVSLHRAEGTGLTIAEAMAIGKPVIATDWSGNTDFADASNSFPVAYELTTVASATSARTAQVKCGPSQTSSTLRGRCSRSFATRPRLHAGEQPRGGE